MRTIITGSAITVQFTRVGESTLYMEILDQNIVIYTPRGSDTITLAETDDKRFKILTRNIPELANDVLFVRGNCKKGDTRICQYMYENSELCDQALANFLLLLKKINYDVCTTEEKILGIKEARYFPQLAQISLDQFNWDCFEPVGSVVIVSTVGDGEILVQSLGEIVRVAESIGPFEGEVSRSEALKWALQDDDKGSYEILVLTLDEMKRVDKDYLWKSEETRNVNRKVFCKKETS